MNRDVSWAETACELVNFPPFSFYPDKAVHVQITTNHWNSTRMNFVHEATVSWVENVNYQNFRVGYSYLEEIIYHMLHGFVSSSICYPAFDKFCVIARKKQLFNENGYFNSTLLFIDRQHS